MLIQSRHERKLIAKRSRNLKFLLPAILAAGTACAAFAQTYAVPTLPTIGSSVYDANVSDPSIGTSNVLVVGTTSTIATNNTTVINDYISYAASHGGGTVVIPTGTYDADEILLGNNVNLDIQTGATLQNFSTTATFVSSAVGATGNVEISGGGILNSNATSTSNNKMVQLEGLTNIEVNDITIENAPNEHLVAECDNNVTINDVTIQDPLKTQANTDGIDFSGTNFLIENCNISDGDDDICAKPDTTVVNGMTAYTANVNIENITITAGHGISIGGQTNAGLNGMYVNNVTETGANTGSSGRISNGIHLKAGDGNTTNNENGGLVQNVTFNNFTMTNVDDVLVINSYYNNGSDNYPSIPAPAYTPTPTEPIWKNITMENINCTNSLGSAAQIYGLNTATPDISGLNFENITFGSTESPWKMYYANDIYMDNVDVAGAELENNETGVKSGGNTENDEADDTNFVTPPNNAPIYTPPLAVVPEPMSLGLMLGAATILGASARANAARHKPAPPAPRHVEPLTTFLSPCTHGERIKVRGISRGVLRLRATRPFPPHLLRWLPQYRRGSS